MLVTRTPDALYVRAKLLPPILILLVVLCHQFNGIWETLESRGVVAVNDTHYQLAVDLGRNLSLLFACAALWASGLRWRQAGMFLTLAAGADTSGLLLYPHHYDSWLWELGCAALSALIVLLTSLRRRTRTYEYTPPTEGTRYKRTGIGPTGTTKKPH